MSSLKKFILIALIFCTILIIEIIGDYINGPYFKLPEGVFIGAIILIIIIIAQKSKKVNK